MNSNSVRAKFLEYFEARDHAVVRSSPLVPAQDPTLLFTNAGMVQFKEAFLGREPRSYTRATSSQRCVRAGGKHNDLENVGYTARHHTFFEMLGNFSFGDYFKREAIAYAWEFVTGEQWLNIPGERLLVTVYADDDEAFGIWRDDIGLPEDRIVRIGDKPGGGSDNFWQMGDTGPCGPCSEIFYDHGEAIAGGPPGSPDEDGDRWVEIWNLVFMQYDRAADGSLNPLPAPSVDTGMGLERVCAVMQGVHDNYDIDLFKALIAAVSAVTGKPPSGSSHKVIAVHIRATAFLIVDGVLPSNEGRGYVLRRIMRRAIRYGHQLGVREPFFHRLVEPLAQQMGEAYPELAQKRDYLAQVIEAEERAFAETLDRGMKLLAGAIDRSGDGVIDGATVFKLYDTYGFPVDLTADIARERGLRIDEAGYEAEMQAQRERARAASQFKGGDAAGVDVDAETEFTGYDRVSNEARVVAIIRDGQTAESLSAGESGTVFLDRTPFYAESGGQVGDTGVLQGTGAEFEVEDTQAQRPGTPGHIGRLRSGSLAVGDAVEACIDADRRDAIRRNHSATHLLHAALREVLGTHVTQKGSLVAPERLRFDFSHPQAVTAEELQRIERLVNEQVLANHETGVTRCSYDEAMAAGAMALFGEKYGDEVRVLRFGDFSTELCGGVHVERTGDIGAFLLLGEGGVASGVRRVEAVTGFGALDLVAQTRRGLQDVSAALKCAPEEATGKLEQLQQRLREAEKQLAAAADRQAAAAGADLASQAADVAGMKVLAARIDGADVPRLRSTLDQLKGQLGSAAIVLSAVNEGKVSLVAGVTKDQTARVRAGDLVNHVAGQVGGKGGGRPDMAQAGGSQPEHLDAALASVAGWIAERVDG